MENDIMRSAILEYPIPDSRCSILYTPDRTTRTFITDYHCSVLRCVEMVFSEKLD